MNLTVPFMDLRVSDEEELRSLMSGIEAVLHHGRLILGPEIDKFEDTIASYCHRKYAISVASGTDALFMALRALEIGEGDQVITNAYSWIATANAIQMTGAKPVFADIGVDLNISPESIEALITPDTKAVLAVNYAGRICDFEKIESITKQHDIDLIEDASQSFGADTNNKIAGSYGDISCISLNPMKVLAACGEAGIVLTDKPELRDKLVIDRYNGMVNKVKCIHPGLNSRMDTLQAAILLKRLPNVEHILRRRRSIAAYYNKELSGMGIDIIHEDPASNNAWFSYIFPYNNRDALIGFLENRGIECKIRDSDFLPNQPAYMEYMNNAETARSIYHKLILLPSSEKLTDEQAEYVIRNMREFHGTV